ncbi:DUF2304 domain-containing protein [Lachnospira multipara]|uniref:DUF2304 domain-containing protein n=1 Tax=Lachnospira multipara TaxID=28051 RepID=A0A1H5WS98_9FIRM|nr:DUF2304 domain-containing protein [Lachnospira multipara]SEG02248.1 hypothetical protein SAMN05216537_1189 [Lachnospira multipara]
MMSLRLRIIIAAILLIGLLYVIQKIKKGKLELRYCITWLLLPIVIFFIVVIPGALQGLANLLGIYNVMNMVFFLGFIFVIAVIFNLTVAVSKLDDRVRKLVQKEALKDKEGK